MKKIDLIVVRGGGDLAAGTIHCLYEAGYPVLILESDHPSAIRREAAFSEAVYEGVKTVEGVTARRIERADRDEVEKVLAAGEIPMLVDPAGESISLLKPDIVLDLIIAKKNLGTTMDMAPFTAAAGPGFTAGKDVCAVVETMRGHDLGRILFEGNAVPNTGVPGNIGGFTSERVIHAPVEGIIRTFARIGDMVEAGQEIAVIEQRTAASGKEEAEMERMPVNATITGLLRGIIRDGYPVTKGFKIADIDPRKAEYKNCFTISDKSRCIAGSMLRLVCAYEHGRI